MRFDLVRYFTIAAVVFLFIGWSPVFAQEEEEGEGEKRGWQDILEDVVRDAAEGSTSSKRLGRIRDIDVVNRSSSVIELEVELQGVVDPNRVFLNAEVFDETYDVLRGFETMHDPIPEGDGTLLVQLIYRGSEDVRSVGAKIQLIDAETDGVATRRKVALPWEWVGDGSGSFSSSGGAMADSDGLSTRSGAEGSVEQREPQIVTLDPRRVGNTPSVASESRADTARPSRRRAPPPPPTSSSTSSSGKDQPTNTATANTAALAIASTNIVMATSLDLYAMAKNATWKSQRGTLPFNGKTSDDRGFVRPKGSTALSNGKRYDKVLQTHPEWKDGGYISGSYDVVIPPAATRFEARAGFLPNVTRSDGVRVSVSLRQGAKSYNLIRKTIQPGDGVVALNATVPESLRGKQVTVRLHVSAGTKSTQDWFAWSAPVIK